MKLIFILILLLNTRYLIACTALLDEGVKDKIKYIESADVIQWVKVINIKKFKEY